MVLEIIKKNGRNLNITMEIPHQDGLILLYRGSMKKMREEAIIVARFTTVVI